MDEELRTAGVYRMFGTNEEMERGALRTIEKDLRRLHERQRVPTTHMGQFGLNLVRSLTTQLYNMPFDLFLQSRLHADFGAVRDAQFVWLACQMSEYVQIAGPSPARSLIPQRMWEANVAMSAAFALLIDDLYAGRTAYAEGYRQSGVLDTGRKLYGMYRDLAASGAPDAVYTLVDAWAGELRLHDWYHWKADDSAGPLPAGARSRGRRSRKRNPSGTVQRRSLMRPASAVRPRRTTWSVPRCRWRRCSTWWQRWSASARCPTTRSLPLPAKLPCWARAGSTTPLAGSSTPCATSRVRSSAASNCCVSNTWVSSSRIPNSTP